MNNPVTTRRVRAAGVGCAAAVLSLALGMSNASAASTPVDYGVGGFRSCLAYQDGSRVWAEMEFGRPTAVTNYANTTMLEFDVADAVYNSRGQLVSSLPYTMNATARSWNLNGGRIQNIWWNNTVPTQASIAHAPAAHGYAYKLWGRMWWLSNGSWYHLDTYLGQRAC